MEKDSEREKMLEQDKIISINQSDAFAKHLGMFIEPVGAHLIERTRALSEWVRQRTELSTWPYARALDQAPATTTRIGSMRRRHRSHANRSVCRRRPVAQPL